MDKQAVVLLKLNPLKKQNKILICVCSDKFHGHLGEVFPIDGPFNMCSKLRFETRLSVLI